MMFISTNKIAEQKLRGKIETSTIMWGQTNEVKELEFLSSKTGKSLLIRPVAWAVVPAGNHSDPYRWDHWFRQNIGTPLKSAVNSAPVPIMGVAVKTKNSTYIFRLQTKDEVRGLSISLRQFPHLSLSNTQLDDVLSIERMSI